MKVTMLVVQGRPRGKFLRFSEGEFLFGRGTECHVRPNSALVSRQHCMLRVAGSGLCLRDLGSTNGTLINGQRLVGEKALEPGDLIQVGPLVLQVVEEHAVKEAGNATLENRLDDTGVEQGAMTCDGRLLPPQ